MNHAFDMSGQVALVTGGARGIGAGIAEMLAEAGATVVIADLDEAAAQQQAAALRDRGLQADQVRIDLADEASIARGCAGVVQRHGPPRVLVNNAGLQDRQHLLEATAAELDRMNAVNGRGPFLMTREIARAMIAAGQGGRIVNIASAALIGSMVKGLSAYAASKGALQAFSRAAALELAEHAITVNTVLPGAVMTPGAMQAKGPAPEGPARRRPALGALSEPRDIGAAVLFFASPAARYITNQVIAVDAGWSLT